MAQQKIKIKLHRTVITLVCLALLVLLMQGASWFSQNHQKVQSTQAEELAQTLARQVAFSLEPLMDDSNEHQARIDAILKQLTTQSRILDASLYDTTGAVIAESGENITVRDRLALDGQRAGSYFSHQLVQPVIGKNGPLGFLRITLDTHVLATESRQVDNTTNILRLMLLLALAIGLVLSQTLLRNRRTHWQQSPFLLTASQPVPQEDPEENAEKPAAPARPAAKKPATPQRYRPRKKRPAGR
ncbi:YtjB family periplasmic protein [Tatumella sp. JGM118]|uniref:YtjB family periplasmic protein n=1 Tax=Tatumella sp. JGM118 TaxID=2799796 RepID=UPI001BAEB72A|nr:YtjB family periplasmic protein [Tatumella sp. JGM118]MBS0908885.1 YtjB family periplasmic protein [Tatumella sp. JGM118]